MDNEVINSTIRNPNSALPAGWRWMRLGETCLIDSNQVSPNTLEAKQLPYIGLEHIESGTGRILGAVNDQNGKLIQSTAFRFDSRHVLYGKLRPYLNKVATPDFGGRCSTELLPLLPRDGCDRYYLAWLLRRAETVEEAMRHKTGTRMPRTDMDELFKTLVPSPSIEKQRRIAAKIQELMAEVEHARTACEKRLEAAKALPSSYLRQVFESDEAKKWERIRLGEVCEIIMGQSPPGDTYNKDGKGLPFFQGKVDFGEVYPTPSSWCTEPKKVAESNDILISVRAPVGPTNLCNEKSCIGRGLAAIRSKGSMNSQFILFFLRFVERDISKTGQGSTFGAIKREHLESMSILFPPLPTQQHLASGVKERITQAEKLRSVIEKQLEAINALPQAVLKKAFRGEL